MFTWYLINRKLSLKNSLKKEYNNERDEFAVAGRVTMKGSLGWITVGHIPRENFLATSDIY